MKTISAQTIDAAWERMCGLPEKQCRELVGRMQKEQPAIMIYLLAMEQSAPGEREPGWLGELGTFIWSILAAEKKDLREVTPEAIEAAEESNIRYLETLDQGSEMDWNEGAGNLIQTYNQGPLLGMMIEILMAGNEETPELAGEEVGMGMLYLKTVIDCLDQ